MVERDLLRATQLLRFTAVHPRERADVRAIMAGDDRVGQQAPRARDESGPKVSDADPRPGVELEVLGEPAVEHQALGRVVVADQPHGVSRAVVAVLVESARGRVGVAEVARRDGRAGDADLELRAGGDEFDR
ncbi:MAG: hypothetical protein M3459_04430, partial [Actinomycetota bacterium]|nr:hypothetical protein [Actinomycetota bacterium]